MTLFATGQPCTQAPHVPNADEIQVLLTDGNKTKSCQATRCGATYRTHQDELHFYCIALHSAEGSRENAGSQLAGAELDRIPSTTRFGSTATRPAIADHDPGFHCRKLDKGATPATGGSNRCRSGADGFAWVSRHEQVTTAIAIANCLGRPDLETGG